MNEFSSLAYSTAQQAPHQQPHKKKWRIDVTMIGDSYLLEFVLRLHAIGAQLPTAVSSARMTCR
jgi:hypothetical protein